MDLVEPLVTEDEDDGTQRNGGTLPKEGNRKRDDPSMMIDYTAAKPKPSNFNKASNFAHHTIVCHSNTLIVAVRIAAVPTFLDFQ